jgi:hypothetical protein
MEHRDLGREMRYVTFTSLNTWQQRFFKLEFEKSGYISCHIVNGRVILLRHSISEGNNTFSNAAHILEFPSH